MKTSSYKTYLLGLGIFSLCCLVALMPGCKKDKENNTSVSTAPQLQLVAEDLVAPLTVVEAPDETKRLFIVDQVGRVWIVKNGKKLVAPFIDLTGKMVSLNTQYDERGLLGMAFHPNYKTNGKFYLFYTAPPRGGGPLPGVSWNNLTRISEFKVSGTNADMADVSSERIVLEADHPQMNHNGGTIAFGKDGYLYISIGDGGGAGDTAAGHVDDWYTQNDGGNAQNIYANLMGKILRIDVNAMPYAIPADNPFTNTPNARPEIYAYGFRNPYRFSFDIGGNNQLYVGDAGQKLFEEISVVTKGGNYGWNIKEGNICFNAANHLSPLASCPAVDTLGNPLVDPIIQLKNVAHPDGDGFATVIVGGHVYRGAEMPSWYGRYIFGIFSRDEHPTAQIFVANGSSYELIKPQGRDMTLGLYLKGFGQDLSGEVYLATADVRGVSGVSGKIYKITGSK